MQRISSWTDLVAALGRFRYGSVTGGVPPTPLKAEWLNMVQEEIANVVLAAGIELDADQEDQLKQAIIKMTSAYLPLAGGTLTGLLRASKGIRAAKGMPSAGNASQVGYGFAGDGDTGLYATGGTDDDGSAVVVVVDGGEVLRFKGDGTLTIAGSHAPYHTGNKPAMLDVVYPIGSIYMNANVATNPAVLLGFGTWVALGTGRMLVGVGTGNDTRGEAKTFTLGETGGEYSHALTAAEMPEHDHSMPQGSVVPAGTAGPTYISGDDVTHSTVGGDEPRTGQAGGGQAHNNLSPYLAVHMWRRSA
jgi:hypothetical protein